MDRSKHVYVCTNKRCAHQGRERPGIAPDEYTRITGRAGECDFCGYPLKWLRKKES